MGQFHPLWQRKQPNGMWGIHDASMTFGNVWYVSSVATGNGTGTSYGSNPASAWSTLAAAYSSGNMASGDLCLIGAGHAETISGAAGVDNSVAGIKVRGLGWGAIRPTFTFTAAASTFAVGANSLWFENLLFLANFTNGVTEGVDIDDAHTDIMFKNCEWRASTSTKEFLKAVTIAASAERITFDSCLFDEEAGDATAAIHSEGALIDLLCRGCRFNGTWSAAVLNLSAGTNVVVRPWFVENYSNNTDTGAGLFALIDSGTVGTFIGNRGGIGKANTVPVSDASASVFIDNLATDAAAISELKYPATATAWS